METETKCKTCKYYVQHYILRRQDEKIREINFGRCLKKRPKNTKPDSFCEYWESVRSKYK